MAIINEIKDQKEKFKGMTFKQKWNYYWDYYKTHTFVTLFLIVAIFFFVRDIVTAKDYAFYSILLNFYSPTATQEVVTNDFATYAAIDLEQYDCLIDTSSTLDFNSMSQADMAVSQKIMAMTQTKSIDVMVSDHAPFQSYARSLMFDDVRTKLSAAEVATYEPYFYYVDAAALENEFELNYDEEGMLITDIPADPRKPETMKDPIPVGIYINDSPKIKEWGAYYGADAILGFVTTSQQTENGYQFFKYLWEESK